jgi:hypothetical protein
MHAMAPRARLTGRVSTWLGLGLGVLLLGTATSSARSAIAVPADLPNRTDQGEFHLRWALVREPDTVRAVGLAESPSRVVSWARVALFGVDRGGRVVSRGESEIPGGFGRNSLPFEVALRPSGREERFELVLTFVNEGKPGD